MENNQMLQENRQRMKHVVAVMSGKGGVGKSTVAVNLAYALALQGKVVGLLDADLHGPSQARLLGVQQTPLAQIDGHPAPIRLHDHLYALSLGFLLEHEDDPVIWRGPAKNSVLKQFVEEIEWPELDYLIIDFPPGTGDEALTMFQLLAPVSGVLLVSTPQHLAVSEARKTIRFAEQLKVPVLGLVENMAMVICPHCGKEFNLYPQGAVELAGEDYGLEVLVRLPFDEDMAKKGDEGRPYAFDCGKKPAGQAYADLALKIVDKLS